MDNIEYALAQLKLIKALTAKAKTIQDAADRAIKALEAENEMRVHCAQVEELGAK